MKFRTFVLGPLIVLTLGFSSLLAESPGMADLNSSFIYSDLKVGDTRDVVLEKLRKADFIQIYEERDRGLVKCSIRWNGFRYELTCKLENGKLTLCLVEGKRMAVSFYDEILNPQWQNLRDRLITKYGAKRQFRDFPNSSKFPWMIRVDTHGHLGFERSLAHAHGSIIQDQGLLYEQDGRVFLLHSLIQPK